eukprot:TRINITY_DN95297_c0_g1_i1.p1 TRINITY_DN95297_c0_g1~~TRINITY_DN95297_c0_g1_i1.p1  ORF type:complete len:299 (-),score=28.42 TRINITY_DN95297_c0_g1_i1:242-1138(-)
MSQYDGDDVVFLHGFGDVNPAQSAVAVALRSIVAQLRPSAQVFIPCYHPVGNVPQTNLIASLEEVARWIATESRSGRCHVVGYSVGGYLASTLASRYPERVSSLLLLAPAIDNFIRNFQSVPPASWYMPAEYVVALRDILPARPAVDTTRIPTTVVHGGRENDGGGSAPWRVAEWVGCIGPGCVFYSPPSVDHSLQPWLSSEQEEGFEGTPPFRQLVANLLQPAMPGKAKQMVTLATAIALSTHAAAGSPTEDARRALRVTPLGSPSAMGRLASLPFHAMRPTRLHEEYVPRPARVFA